MLNNINYVYVTMMVEGSDNTAKGHVRPDSNRSRRYVTGGGPIEVTWKLQLFRLCGRSSLLITVDTNPECGSPIVLVSPSSPLQPSGSSSRLNVQ